MKLEYKQFEFAETLRDMDSVLLPEYDKLVPKNQFLTSFKTNLMPGRNYDFEFLYFCETSQS